MRKKKLLSLLLLLPPLALAAQIGSVSKITGSSSHSLVAEWNQAYHIVFSQSSLSSTHLYWIKKDSSLAYKIEMPPYLHMSDMKVKDDTLFFVGYHNNSRRGMWGFVALGDITGSEVAVNSHTANTMAAGYLNEGIQGPTDPYSFVNFDKMEIVAGNTSRTQIVAIGERRRLLPGETALYDTKRCLFLLDPYDNPTFVYARNEDLNEYYDDLAMVGDLLVCSFRKNRTTASSIPPYGYRILTTPDSLFNSSQAGFAYSYTDDNSASAVLLADLGGGDWATIHYGDKDGIGDKGITVGYTHANTSLHPIAIEPRERHWIPCKLSAADKLRDAAFSPASASLMVLADITTPLFSAGHSVAFRFRPSQNSGYPCQTKAYVSGSNTLFALSPSGNQKMIACGKRSSNLLLIWDNIATSTSCLQADTIDATCQRQPDIGKHQATLSIATGTSSMQRHICTKTSATLTNLCH